jgi:hypothetical protein
VTVLYEVEVSLEVAADAAAFVGWMRDEHVPQVLASGCFARARVCVSEDGARFKTVYEAADAAALARYLKDFAPPLREHFARRFPTGAKVGRTVWSTATDQP